MRKVNRLSSVFSDIRFMPQGLRLAIREFLTNWLVPLMCSLGKRPFTILTFNSSKSSRPINNTRISLSLVHSRRSHTRHGIRLLSIWIPRNSIKSYARLVITGIWAFSLQFLSFSLSYSNWFSGKNRSFLLIPFLWNFLHWRGELIWSLIGSLLHFLILSFKLLSWR